MYFVREKKNRCRLPLCLALMLAGPCASPSVVRHDPLVLDPVWLRMADQAWPSAGELFDLPSSVYGEPPTAAERAEDQPGFAERWRKGRCDAHRNLSRGMDHMLGARETYADEAYDSLSACVSCSASTIPAAVASSRAPISASACRARRSAGA